MPVPTVPPLTLRLVKGAPLSASDHDTNLTTLRDSINGLAALLGVTVQSDGTMIPDAISRPDILGDRVVTYPKLGFLANHFGVATLDPSVKTPGSHYAMTMEADGGSSSDPCSSPDDLGFPTPPGNGSTRAFVAPVMFMNVNPASPVTLNVNGHGPYEIRKNDKEQILEKEIHAGAIHWLAFTKFGADEFYQVVGPVNRVKKIESEWQKMPTAGGAGPALQHTENKNPDIVTWWARPVDGTDSADIGGWPVDKDKPTELDVLNSLYAYVGSGDHVKAAFVVTDSTSVRAMLLEGGYTYGFPGTSGKIPTPDLTKWESQLRAVWIY